MNLFPLITIICCDFEENVIFLRKIIDTDLRQLVLYRKFVLGIDVSDKFSHRRFSLEKYGLVESGDFELLKLGQAAAGMGAEPSSQRRYSSVCLKIINVSFVKLSRSFIEPKNLFLRYFHRMREKNVAISMSNIVQGRTDPAGLQKDQRRVFSHNRSIFKE